jgi:hypothetical protein
MVVKVGFIENGLIKKRLSKMLKNYEFQKILNQNSKIKLKSVFLSFNSFNNLKIDE